MSVTGFIRPSAFPWSTVLLSGRRMGLSPPLLRFSGEFQTAVSKKAGSTPDEMHLYDMKPASTAKQNSSFPSCNSASCSPPAVPKFAVTSSRLGHRYFRITPPAKMELHNLYRDETLRRQLAIKVTAWTAASVPRRGGLDQEHARHLRQHQFQKVETLQIHRIRKKKLRRARLSA